MGFLDHLGMRIKIGAGAKWPKASTSWCASWAGVARGFKGGDFNGGALFAPTEANITGPEYVTSFEAGVKGATADRRFGFDAAAFYYDFSDQQVSILVPGSHATLQQLANAGKTGVKGIEGEITLRPADSLRIEARGAFTDARFVRFQRDAGAALENICKDWRDRAFDAVRAQE